MHALGAAFSAGLAGYLVFVRQSVDASDTGFSLAMAVSFSSNILWVSVIQVSFESSVTIYIGQDSGFAC